MIFKHCKVMRIFFRYLEVLYQSLETNCCQCTKFVKAAAATPISSLLPHTSLEDLLISAILLAVPLVFVGEGLVGSSAQTKVEFLNSLEFSTCNCRNGKIRTIYWLH